MTATLIASLSNPPGMRCDLCGSEHTEVRASDRAL